MAKQNKFFWTGVGIKTSLDAAAIWSAVDHAVTGAKGKYTRTAARPSTTGAKSRYPRRLKYPTAASMLTASAKVASSSSPNSS